MEIRAETEDLEAGTTTKETTDLAAETEIGEPLGRKFSLQSL